MGLNLGFGLPVSTGRPKKSVRVPAYTDLRATTLLPLGPTGYHKGSLGWLLVLLASGRSLVWLQQVTHFPIT